MNDLLFCGYEGIRNDRFPQQRGFDQYQKGIRYFGDNSPVQIFSCFLGGFGVFSYICSMLLTMTNCRQYDVYKMGFNL